ncbi:MAG: ATP synthase F1 subunit gamma [Candidatus Omnitrophica bacterium]|nr:ATP synthase F1 subunit gamma [Candidatus Omnitrophota bacterium]MDD5042513.1 ATP synthase F1 subunit gamma [Candidatus Omnitrophota bacterium]MDD5500726.1 ATP synthase F1 subunit gamma [Candidatus Omnitrophota bacterium]
MPQSIKQIKNRIRSVENTKKVTNAMQMISVAKLNHIESSLFSLRPYVSRLGSLMHNLLALSGELSIDYLRKDQLTRDVALCLITSDSGLCGAYNQNVIRTAEDFIREHGEGRVKLILVGQKGANYFRSKSADIDNSYIGLNGRFSPQVCSGVTGELSRLFLEGKVNSVHLAYTYFENSLTHRPVLERLLCIERIKTKPVEYIIEPDLKTILADLIPVYLSAKMQLVFLEAFTSEHASRIISMKTATDNAKELLGGLLLLRNKLRQAGITQDILEISSSVEALKRG